MRPAGDMERDSMWTGRMGSLTIAVNLGGEEVSLPGGEEERMGETDGRRAFPVATDVVGAVGVAASCARLRSIGLRGGRCCRRAASSSIFGDSPDGCPARVARLGGRPRLQLARAAASWRERSSCATASAASRRSRISSSRMLLLRRSRFRASRSCSISWELQPEEPPVSCAAAWIASAIASACSVQARASSLSASRTSLSLRSCDTTSFRSSASRPEAKSCCRSSLTSTCAATSEASRCVVLSRSFFGLASRRRLRATSSSPSFVAVRSGTSRWPPS
mmetsp:Transcript_103877/g.224196  ORF Transcript_103877/g.224196 Transcript_103877/m.224196 type:complete len:278 (+) Transcript_103877:272-1105(+)